MIFSKGMPFSLALYPASNASCIFSLIVSASFMLFAPVLIAFPLWFCLEALERCHRMTVQGFFFRQGRRRWTFAVLCSLP